jgi:hemerythrin-like domain-containing protein
MALLAELDQLDSCQPEFERLLSAFTQAAREHFDFEERQVWPRLRAALNSGALTAKAADELGHRILQARQAVPVPPFPRESASSS